MTFLFTDILTVCSN